MTVGQLILHDFLTIKVLYVDPQSRRVTVQVKIGNDLRPQHIMAENEELCQTITLEVLQ